MFTRKHIVLISGLLLAPPLSAHTLSQAIQLALSQNPEIMSARQGVGMAHEKVDQAEAGWMPTVDLTYDRGTEYKNKEGSDHTRLTREATSLTVNQPIFDGGATSAAVERSGQLHRASTIHLDEIRSSVTLKAIEAWYEVYRLQRVIKLTETNVKEHKKVVTQIRLKVEAGGAGKDELARAETP